MKYSFQVSSAAVVIGTLTHCRLNELPQTIYCKILFCNFRYVRLCDLDIPREKWLNHLQTVKAPSDVASVASDLGLHCLPFTLLEVSRLQWVND